MDIKEQTEAKLPWWKEPTQEQWFSFLAAWLGWVLDAFDFTIFFLVMPLIAKEFNVSISATAGVVTLTLVFRFFGGIIAGYAADRVGRKLPLMVSIIWFAVCDAAIAFATSFNFILIMRTLFGLGMGAEWTAGTTLAMENWPKRSRSIISGILQGSFTIGFLLAAIATGIVVPIYGWRTLFLIAALPALLVIPIRFFVPESKEWIQKTSTAIEKPNLIKIIKSEKIIKKIGWSSAFMMFGMGAYYSLTSLYPTMLQNQLGFTINDVTKYVVLFNIGMLIGTISCGIMATRFSIMISVVIPTLISIGLIPFYLGLVPGMLLISALFMGCFGQAMSGIAPVLLTSLFSTEIRSRIVGTVFHAGALGAAIMPVIIAKLSENTKLSLASSMAVVVLICDLGVLLVLISQRKLLTLDSIKEHVREL